MSRDDVIRMARVAGASQLYGGAPALWGEEAIERFAAMVAADEREACALACEQLEYKAPFPEDVIEDCATAIRARGKP